MYVGRRDRCGNLIGETRIGTHRKQHDDALRRFDNGMRERRGESRPESMTPDRRGIGHRNRRDAACTARMRSWTRKRSPVNGERRRRAKVLVAVTPTLPMDHSSWLAGPKSSRPRWRCRSSLPRAAPDPCPWSIYTALEAAMFARTCQFVFSLRLLAFHWSSVAIFGPTDAPRRGGLARLFGLTKMHDASASETATRRDTWLMNGASEMARGPRVTPYYERRECQVTAVASYWSYIAARKRRLTPRRATWDALLKSRAGMKRYVVIFLLAVPLLLTGDATTLLENTTTEPNPIISGKRT